MKRKHLKGEQGMDLFELLFGSGGSKNSKKPDSRKSRNKNHNDDCERYYDDETDDYYDDDHDEFDE